MRKMLYRLGRFGAAAAFLLGVAGAVPHAALASNIFDDDWTPPKAEAPPRLVLPDSNPAAPDAKDAPGADPTKLDPPPPPVSNDHAGALPPGPAARSPIPSKQDLAHSRQILREVFSKQLRDHSVAGRRRLADALLQQAATSADNPADQYVLLGGAIDAAREGASLALCFDAANTMGARYEVDSLSVKRDATLAAKFATTSISDNAQNAFLAMNLLDNLLAIEDDAAANHLCELLSHAKVPPVLRAAVDSKIKEAHLQHSAQQAATQALAQLSKDPNDPAASLALGSYCCFWLGQWQKGLPYLARSSDRVIKAAADSDRAATASEETCIKAGDAWADASETAQSTPRHAMRNRAVSFYRKVLERDQARGLMRARLEQRIASLSVSSDLKIPATPADWISNGASYTVTSSRTDFPPSKNLMDGRGAAYMNDFSVHTTEVVDPFIVIDLGGPCVVSKVQIVNRVGPPGEREKTLTVWTGPTPDGPWQEGWRAQTVEHEWNVPLHEPVICRYVKMGLRATEQLNLSSVKIFGQKLF